MSIVKEIDAMISELGKKKLKPEYVIMGRGFFYKWIVEVTREGNISLNTGKKRHKYYHNNIPVIVCDSEILEVVPDPGYMLE